VRVGTRTVRLALKVVPGASRDAVAGWLGDTLKVRVTAPPERGKANAAVVRLLASALGASRDDVRLVSGAPSPQQVGEIAGLTREVIRARLTPEKP